MAGIDSLSINITATTTVASKHIAELETKLTSLSQSLEKLTSGSKLDGLANGVNALASAMKNMKDNTSTPQFNALAKNIAKLGDIDSGKIDATASSISRLAPALQGMSGIGIDKSVTSLTNALTKLSETDVSKFTSADFDRLGQSLSSLTNSLAQSERVSSSTITLVNALSRLSATSGTITTVATALPTLGTQLRVLSDEMAKASAISNETTQFVTAIATLASAGKKAEMTASSLGKLGRELLKLIETLNQAPRINADVLSFVNALGSMSSKSFRVSSGLSTLGASFDRLVPKASRLKSSFGGLAVAFGKFYANCWLALRAFKGLWHSVESSMNASEIYNYFDATTSQLAEKGAKDYQEMGYFFGSVYAKSLQQELKDQMAETTKMMTGYTMDAKKGFRTDLTKSLGINPSEFVQYQSQFAQLGSSMGITSDYAVKLSDALTKLGADLASVKDLAFTDVWSSLSSGMVGMARSVDQFGANIREANLNAKLMELGIETTAKKLGQEDKALLRTIILLDSTRFAWGDLANTLSSSSNQTRLLSANFNNLSRTIGSLLVGAITNVLPYINALIMAIQQLLQITMDLFGIEVPMVTAQSSNGFAELNDYINGTEEAMDGASSSAKKLKQNLLGIDELTVINTDNGGGGGGSFSAVSDDLKKAFDKIFAEYNKAWEDAYAKASNKAQELADKIVKAIQKGDWYAIGRKASELLEKALSGIKWDDIYKFASHWGENLANFLNGLLKPETFFQIGKTIAGLLNTAFEFAGSFVKTFDWINAGFTLASLVNGFAKTINAKLLGETISTAIIGALKMVKEFLRKTDFYEIGVKIGQLLASIDWIECLSQLGAVILNALIGVVKLIAGMITGGFLENPIGTIATVFATSLGVKIALAVGALNMLPTINKLCTLFTGSPLIGETGTTIGNTIFKGITSAFSSSGLGQTVASAFNAPSLFALTGNQVGVAIASSIGVAIAGYGLGTLIYKSLIEDTEWDAFGYDIIHKNDEAKQQKAIEESVQRATDMWNKSLVAVADQLDWSGLFNFEGTDVWASEIENINNALALLGQQGVDIADTSLAMDTLDISLLNLNETEKNFIRDLSENYSGLDDLAKSALYAQYGIGELSGEYASLVPSTMNMAEATGVYSDNLQSLADGTFSTLEKQNAFKDLNIDLVEIYGREKKALDSASDSLNFFGESAGNTTESTTGLKTGFLETITATTNYADTLRIASERMGDTSYATQLLQDNFDKLPTSVQKSIAEVEKLKVSSDNVTSSFFDNNTAMADSSAGMDALANTMVVTNASFDDVAKTISELTTTDITNFNKATEEMETTVTTATANIETGFNDMATTVGTSFDESERVIAETLARIDTDSIGTLTKIRGQLGTVFSQSKIEDELKGIEPAFTKIFSGVSKVIATEFNKLIEAINNAFEVSWDDLEIDGEKIMSAGKAKLIKIAPIQGFKTGGFIEDGLFTMNNGEIAGKFNNGKSVVANNEQIIEGIKRGVSEAVASQMIPYLSSIANTNEQIANKEFGITSTQAYNAVVYENNKEIMTRGNSRLAW